MTDVAEEFAAIGAYLERDGFAVRRDGHRLLVGEAVVDLPLDLLDAYLAQQPAPPWGGDPRAEALSLLQVHLVEELGTDHGEGVNRTRRVGLRRRGGRVLLSVEQAERPPRPAVEPDPHLVWRAEPPTGAERPGA
jgi:hypothetical protein